MPRTRSGSNWCGQRTVSVPIFRKEQAEAVFEITDDWFVSLEDRVRIAEEAGATVYVSVHINSYSTDEAYGAETIVAAERPLDDDSWVLAELIQDGLIDATGARDRGTRSQESYASQRALVVRWKTEESA